MKYDKYIEQGFPIGTGIVESTCKTLVKDRMEGSGKRWSLNEAEAMLKLRSVKTRAAKKERKSKIRFLYCRLK